MRRWRTCQANGRMGPGAGEHEAHTWGPGLVSMRPTRGGRGWWVPSKSWTPMITSPWQTSASDADGDDHTQRCRRSDESTGCGGGTTRRITSAISAQQSSCFHTTPSRLISRQQTSRQLCSAS